MTDKELIKQEIEKQKSFYQRTFDVLHPDDLDATIAYANIELLDRLLQFIDSIREEPVGEDLEEEVNNWRHNHFHGRRDKDASGEYLERESQLELARHFAEWQKQKSMQDFLEKAEKWLEDTQIENFICRDDGIYFENEKFVQEFKKYMQNEIQN